MNDRKVMDLTGWICGGGIAIAWYHLGSHPIASTATIALCVFVFLAEVAAAL